MTSEPTAGAPPQAARAGRHFVEGPGRDRFRSGRRLTQPATARGGTSDAGDRKVSLLELLAIAGPVVIGLMGLVSLAAAHLGHNTPGVIFPIWAVAVLVVALVIWLLDAPRLRIDLPGLVVGAAAAGLAAFMFIPGFWYATGDKDPGTYVGIAAAIQKYHSLPFPDPLTSPSLPAVAKPSSVLSTWPALWSQPGHPGWIFPQFYHLWPALLVATKDVGGWTGLFNTGPLVGVIAVAGAVAVARRVAGMTGAVVAGTVLATNMLQVWQAKYPSSEIFGQLLFVGALLGAVVAVRTGWKSAAALSGMLLGLGYLERADGIVPILIAWAMLGALLAARRFDWRAGWFAIGLLALLPYGFYQAYDLAKTYTLTNNVPSLRDVLAIMIGLAVVAGILAWQGRAVQWLLRRAEDGRLPFRVGVVFVVVCAALMIIGYRRPELFGPAYERTGTGQIIRSYDEMSLVRLSWFFSDTGLVLLGAGIVWIACRRWRVENWIVCLTAVPLLTLYAWHTHNSPYLMWDFRRFVVNVVPEMAILIGCGVAWCAWVLRRYLPRAVVTVGVVAVTVYFGVFYLSESAPLRHHDEAGGSLQVVQTVKALVAPGSTGVFFWDPNGPCCAAPHQLFGSPLMTLMGQDSALAPSSTAQLSRLLDYYLTRSDVATHPVFYVGNGGPEQITVPGVALTPLKQLVGNLPEWQETYTSRPKKDSDYHYDFTVYKASLG